MNLKLMYDINEDVLFARKSDCQKKVIGDEYFIVPKEEWLCEDGEFNSFIFSLQRLTGTEYPCS